MQIKHIDNGFFQISTADARKLAGGKLPRHGFEKLVKAPERFLSENNHFEPQWLKSATGFVWLARTVTWGKQVWSIREAKVSKGYLSA